MATTFINFFYLLIHGVFYHAPSNILWHYDYEPIKFSIYKPLLGSIIKKFLFIIYGYYLESIKIFDFLPEEIIEIKKILSQTHKHTSIGYLNEENFKLSSIIICRSQWFDFSKNHWVYIKDPNQLIFSPLNQWPHHKIIWENLEFLHNPEKIPKIIIHPKEMESILLSLYFKKIPNNHHLILRNPNYKLQKIYTYNMKNINYLPSYSQTSKQNHWDTIYFYHHFFKLVYPWDYNIIIIKPQDARQSDSNFLILKQNLRFFNSTINNGEINEHDHYKPTNKEQIIINLPPYYINEFNKKPHTNIFL